jgi:phage shock protein PspC (stress-responsive transcriptional regulator)
MNPSADTTPLLAGVCSRFASTLHFNVWALRAVCIVLLLAKTILAVIVYGILALLFHALDRRRDRAIATPEPPRDNLAHPGRYSERISDLDKRFREWEQSLRK